MTVKAKIIKSSSQKEIGQKLRIAFFVDTFFPTYDGVVIYIDNIVRALSDFCEITVFCPGMENDEFYQKFPYKIVRCPFWKIWGFPYEIANCRWNKIFTNYFQKHNFDIVHVHSPFMVGKIGYKCGLKNRIPIITTLHSQYHRDFYHYTKSKLLTKILIKKIMYWVNKSNEVWVNNNAMMKLTQKKYCCRAKMRILSNFTNHKLINHDEKQKFNQLFRKKYQISKNTKILLFVGRLVKVKNIFFLARVAYILAKKKFNFKLFFVGSGVNAKQLKRKIKHHKLTDKVVFLGKVDGVKELEKIYAVSDLFVFPSKYDTNSIVQLEAATQFTPTLFLNNAVTAGAIKNNQGYTSLDNPYCYAKKIIEIFHDQKQYDKVREHCHSIVKTLTQSREEIYSSYLEVLENYNLQNRYHKS